MTTLTQAPTADKAAADKAIAEAPAASVVSEVVPQRPLDADSCLGNFGPNRR